MTNRLLSGAALPRELDATADRKRGSKRDKMLAGELYDATASEFQADLAATHRWLARYNAALDMAPPSVASPGRALRRGGVIRPPFHCEYGSNIRLGAGVFLNFNCVILDVVEVTIGDHTQIGPGVQILKEQRPEFVRADCRMISELDI
jgi:maltose O-acetyltransferase